MGKVLDFAQMLESKEESELKERINWMLEDFTGELQKKRQRLDAMDKQELLPVMMIACFLECILVMEGITKNGDDVDEKPEDIVGEFMVMASELAQYYTLRLKLDKDDIQATIKDSLQKGK